MITYYHANSPMGVTVKATRARVGGPIKVAVVGLGTGTFACFSEPGDNFKFYEIDASVREAGARSELFPLSHRMRAGCSGRARRCAADARRERGPVRPDRARCVLVRRDPDPSDDARGDGDLSVEARAARHRDDARLEPPHGACLRGRRHRACQRPGQPRQQPRGARRRGRRRSTCSPRPSSSARARMRISARCARTPTGPRSSRPPASASGPTIIPT